MKVKAGPSDDPSELNALLVAAIEPAWKANRKVTPEDLLLQLIADADVVQHLLVHGVAIERLTAHVQELLRITPPVPFDAASRPPVTEQTSNYWTARITTSSARNAAT